MPLLAMLVPPLAPTLSELDPASLSLGHRKFVRLRTSPAPRTARFHAGLRALPSFQFDLSAYFKDLNVKYMPSGWDFQFLTRSLAGPPGSGRTPGAVVRFDETKRRLHARNQYNPSRSCFCWN